MTRPTKPCHICGSDNWWWRPDGSWVCGRCHPNPNLDASPVPPVVEEQYSPAVFALRDRVKVGTEKLFRAWQQIMEISDKEERGYQEDKWEKARDKLHYLCMELQVKGYVDCLYIENGKKMRRCLDNPDGFWCQVCPSLRPYWEEELIDLP